ncbi:MAG: hypothetical protein KGK02_01980 [Rhodospirillales bacterium]|nr:hypothetical protein [Rhodospirillales bacterium]
MRAQTTPSVSPGGNAVAAARGTSSLQSHPAQPRRTEPSNDRDDFNRYDDGLVHGHFWAMSSTVR